ncbi:hypothethical protein [Ralstonia solanacearum K60]|nr:hypothethical protein [Ralstonia solanacearum K60]
MPGRSRVVPGSNRCGGVAMTKLEFMQLMRFPVEWITLEMYPDELFQWQLAGYQPRHEEGAEHDRNGAFHWWLRRQPTKIELEKLLRLAALDPDPFLGEDLRQYIRKASAFDERLAVLDRELFAHRG